MSSHGPHARFLVVLDASREDAQQYLLDIDAWRDAPTLSSRVWPERKVTKEIRQKFNALISKANELETAAAKSMEEKYLRQMDADIDTWEASAREFVGTEFPDSLPLFESNATSIAGQMHSRHPAINRLLMRIRNRVERLTQLPGLSKSKPFESFYDKNEVEIG